MVRHNREILVHRVAMYRAQPAEWLAVFDGYDIYDSAQPIGRGPTERDAIHDLLITADMDDDK